MQQSSGGAGLSSGEWVDAAASSSGEHIQIDQTKFVALALAALGEDLLNELMQALQHLDDFTRDYQMPPVVTSSRDSSVGLTPI